MLIYDKFPTLEKAKQCQSELRSKYGRLSIITEDIEQAQFLDPFPYELAPPILLVCRFENTEETEADLEVIATKYGGVFAGT